MKKVARIKQEHLTQQHAAGKAAGITSATTTR
ncbi:hypothetical protein P3T16_004528 [Paraburkholderia sp. GAS42]|jgi:hypothetical protein